MTKSILRLLIGSMMLGLAVAPAADKAARQGLDDRMHALNETVKKKSSMKTALHGVSVETGVPLATVESMHKHHPDTGPAGILVACVLADETKKPAEQLVKKHEDGKTWAEIARENKVPVEKLDRKLDNLEKFLASPGDKEGKGKRHKD